VQQRIDEAKQQRRPHLKLQHWSCEHYASNQAICAFSEERGAITRVHSRELPPSLFASSFERSNSSAGRACIIEGVPQAENWNAAENWSWEKLAKLYGGQQLSCAGTKAEVVIKLDDFIAYMRRQKDDSPLYVFDGTFGAHPVLKSLLEDYKPPKCVGSDLFALLGEQRPPFRWFALGPQRSGSNVHIDPLATSAWNTLIKGRKRWILFDPRTPKAVVQGMRYVVLDNDAVHWFTEVLPRVKADVAALDTFDPPLEIIEFVQHASETVFIPSGWWHAVLNLDDTMAVTQVRRLEE
jgi:histone arginine demethylase JMJD6